MVGQSLPELIKSESLGVGSITIGEGNGIPLQHSCLENPMDGGAWWALRVRVAKSQTDSDFTFTFHFHALEKEMATHSSVLAWRIPGMGEPCGLLSGVAQNWTRLKRLSSSSSITIIIFIFTSLGDLKGLTKDLDGCLLQHK